MGNRENNGDRLPDSRYRVTRAAFDVVSVFPALRATAVPGPVFCAVLALHGYSESAVRNRLVRMVDHGQLVRERHGTTAVFRVAPQLRRRFLDIQQGFRPPPWQGRFHALVYAIPESARSLRDRLGYLARYHGYRQLRPGLFLAFADYSAELRPRLSPLLDRADTASPPWADLCWMTTENEVVARNWVRRAFVSTEVAGRIGELSRRAARLDRSGPRALLPQYMDLLYEAMKVIDEVPVLPVEFADLDDGGERLAEVFATLYQAYVEVAAEPVFRHAMELPAARLIEFEPDFSFGVG